MWLVMVYEREGEREGGEKEGGGGERKGQRERRRGEGGKERKRRGREGDVWISEKSENSMIVL